MTTRSSRRPGRPRDPDHEQRRRAEILDVAGRIFAESGYAKTDLQVVADKLGIGKGTIYRYYPSKRDLFMAIVDRGLTELNQEIEKQFNSGVGPVVIENCIRTYLEFFDRNPHMVELFIQERAEFRDRKVSLYFETSNAECDKHLKRVQQMIDEGYLRPVPPQRILDVVADLLYGTIFANYLSRRVVDVQTQAAEIVDIVFRGILSDTERQRSRGNQP